MRPDNTRATGRSYTHPRRPLPIRIFNFFGSLASLCGFRKKIRPQGLYRSAVRKEGLHNFGPEDIDTPLSQLLDSINGESYLTPFGRMVTRIRLTGTLRNRLRAEKWFALHPEILEQELPPLTVITGLQRTGTTMLHRLLSADPDTRSLSSWEALNPAPFFELSREDEREKRLKSARVSERMLGYIAPDFFAVHPVEAEAPEEDVLLLDYSFLSTVPEATLRVPSYSRWLEEQDQEPAYRYLEKMLKLLQWQNPGKRWILKTPHHMEYLDTLFSVFPGTRVIQTHRCPATTLASFCSMIAHGRGVFSNRIDPKEIGRDWKRKIRMMVNNTLEVRKKMGPEKFIDIQYGDLVADPVQEVEKIYSFLNIPWSPGLEKTMENTLSRNRQYKYGHHNYVLEDFGLNRQEIEREFGEYYDIHIRGEKVL